VAELHVYDFDGTLFRSPYSPALWDNDWWSDPESLMPPCVPDQAGDEWWIEDTVNAARQSIGRQDVFALLMTGRKADRAFRYRVPDLLKQHGLSFDAVHLDEGQGGDSFDRKVQRIETYLVRYPFIDTIRIWDDRPSHLKKFKKILGDAGYKVHVTHVKGQAMDPLCEVKGVTRVSSPAKAAYVGIFLDARSKATLQYRYGLLHDKPKAEHVTLSLNLTPELEALVGQRVSVKVVGYAEDEHGQAVVVQLPDALQPLAKKGIPHVTLTHDASVQPKYSNDLLARGYMADDGPVLHGIIDTSPSRLRRV
jgi:hypothetical protein